jgi:hypothetical protein
MWSANEDDMSSYLFRPNLPADENFFPLFLFFFSSYVGYVPASDDLGIFGIDWQCGFSSKFLFVTEKKSTFHRNNFVGPRSPKTL